MSDDREHEFTDEEASWFLSEDDYRAQIEAGQGGRATRERDEPPAREGGL